MLFLDMDVSFGKIKRPSLYGVGDGLAQVTTTAPKESGPPEGGLSQPIIMQTIQVSRTVKPIGKKIAHQMRRHLWEL
jgi:hypothetical protein